MEMEGERFSLFHFSFVFAPSHSRPAAIFHSLGRTFSDASRSIFLLSFFCLNEIKRLIRRDTDESQSRLEARRSGSPTERSHSTIFTMIPLLDVPSYWRCKTSCDAYEYAGTSTPQQPKIFARIGAVSQDFVTSSIASPSPSCCTSAREPSPIERKEFRLSLLIYLYFSRIRQFARWPRAAPLTRGDVSHIILFHDLQRMHFDSDVKNS